MKGLAVLLMSVGLMLAMALPAMAAPPSHANGNSCSGSVVSNAAPVGDDISWVATNFEPGGVAALVAHYASCRA